MNCVCWALRSHLAKANPSSLNSYEKSWPTERHISEGTFSALSSSSNDSSEDEDIKHGDIRVAQLNLKHHFKDKTDFYKDFIINKTCMESLNGLSVYGPPYFPEMSEVCFKQYHNLFQDIPSYPIKQKKTAQEKKNLRRSQFSKKREGGRSGEVWSWSQIQWVFFTPALTFSAETRLSETLMGPG